MHTVWYIPTDDLALTMFTMTFRGKYYYHSILQVRKLRFSKFKQLPPETSALCHWAMHILPSHGLCARPLGVNVTDTYQLCDLGPGSASL